MRRFQKRVGSGADFFNRARSERLFSLESEKIFLLRCDQVRAVESKQRLSLAHQSPGVIYQEFFDPTFDFAEDLSEPRLVVRDNAHGPNFLNHRPDLGGCRSYAHQLLSFRTYVHSDRTHVVASHGLTAAGRFACGMVRCGRIAIGLGIALPSPIADRKYSG